MTEEDQFWFEVLRDYRIDEIPSLPYDRQPIISEHLSHNVYSTILQFDSELATRFLHHAAHFNSTSEHVSLAIYYIFLLKLANGQKRFYIGRNLPRPHAASHPV